jgi:hypothetical protein
LVKPLAENEDVGAVGGWCPMVASNELQRKVERTAHLTANSIPVGDDCHPSSRNIAFRRTAWEAVGGYPEWLTLTAEDFLFNENLRFAGVRFYYQPTAVVAWEGRADLRSHLKLMRNYGYGCGEVRLGGQKYMRWLATTLFPPLMLFSQSRFADLPFRYVSNAAGAYGYLAGALFGHRPPRGWRRIEGRWVSPQAIAAAQNGRYAPVADRSR